LTIVLFVAWFFVGMPALLSQDPPQRKPLAFADKEKSRVYSACELAVRLNLVGRATTGDIDQACRCVESAYAASETGIPAEYRKNHLWMRPEGEVINLIAVYHTSRGDLVPGPVRIVADRMGWEARSCLGPLLTRSQLTGTFARDWLAETNPKMNYRGPIVEPVEGLPASVNKNLDGLIFADLSHLRGVIDDSIGFDGNEPLQQTLDRRHAAFEFLQGFGRNAGEFVVLSCRYRTQARNNYDRWQSSTPYHYWYKPVWEPLVAELVAAAPDGHPVRGVGPARESCPLERPTR
jgi:hypothetical protein